MYEPQSDESVQLVLNERLECDASGELRKQLIEELQMATQDIGAALDERPGAAQVEVLHNLLEAVRLSECILMEVWDSFHG